MKKKSLVVTIFIALFIVTIGSVYLGNSSNNKNKMHKIYKNKNKRLRKQTLTKNSLNYQPPKFCNTHPVKSCTLSNTVCCQRQPCDNVGSYLNSSRIKTNCSLNLNIDASFLYWYSREEGLEAGNIVLQQNFNPNFNPDFGDSFFGIKKVKYLEIPFEYHPAFKIDMGAKLCHDNWSINLIYFRYYIDRHNSFALPSITNFYTDHFIDPFWMPDAEFFSFSIGWNEAKSKWKLATNIIDFELSRESYFGKCFTVRPYIGLRGGIIDQKLNVNYKSVDDFTIPFGPDRIGIGTYDSSNKSESWLLGPRLGLQSKWHLIKFLNLIVNGAVSSFYQKLNLKTKDVGFINLTNFTFGPSNFTAIKKISQVSASFEAGVGLETGAYFCNKKYYYSLSANYDIELFLHQNWMRTLMNQSNIIGHGARNEGSAIPYAYCDNSPGNLMFHGLTLSAKLDF